MVDSLDQQTRLIWLIAGCVLAYALGPEVLEVVARNLNEDQRRLMRDLMGGGLFLLFGWRVCTRWRLVPVLAGIAIMVGVSLQMKWLLTAGTIAGMLTILTYPFLFVRESERLSN